MPSEVVTACVSARRQFAAPPGPRSAVALHRSSLTRVHARRLSRVSIRGSGQKQDQMDEDPHPYGCGENPTAPGAVRLFIPPCGQPWTGSSDSSRAAGDSFWASGSCLLVVAVPFASQQTKHLTAGGFEVPGSGSLAVADAIKRFPGVQTEPLILVFDNRKKDPAALSAAVDKAAQEIKGVDNVGDVPAGRGRGEGRGDQQIVLRRRSTSTAARTPRSTRRSTCARTCTSRTATEPACRCTSSASRRCGRACRTSPRRTSRRPSSPASRSSSSCCSPSSARWRRRCCRSPRRRGRGAHRRGRLLPLAARSRCRSS